jgi:hypothetical protein
MPVSVYAGIAAWSDHTITVGKREWLEEFLELDV